MGLSPLPQSSNNHNINEKFTTRKMSRYHVHLSSDHSTAKIVGQRHGKPVVFEVATGSMDKDGFVFYCSANQVWLVDIVPPEYLEISEDSKT